MKELRCLVFTEIEAIKAILDRRRTRREPLPTGTVQAIVYDADSDEITATLRIIDDDGADHSMMVGSTELAAAMVGYCMGRKIPLPVDSDKCLYLIKGALTLMITMNFNKPPRFVPDTEHEHDEHPVLGPVLRNARTPRRTG